MKYELCWKYSVLDYDMHQCRVLINFERDITDGNWRVVAIVLDIPPSRSIFWYFSGLLYNMKTEGGGWNSKHLGWSLLSFSFPFECRERRENINWREKENVIPSAPIGRSVWWRLSGQIFKLIPWNSVEMWTGWWSIHAVNWVAFRMNQRQLMWVWKSWAWSPLESIL